MLASLAPNPDHLFSEAPQLAEGVMISGRRTGGGWRTADVSLLRENS